MNKVLSLRLNALDCQLLEEAKQIISDTVHIDVNDSVVLKTALTLYVQQLRINPDITRV